MSGKERNGRTTTVDKRPLLVSRPKTKPELTVNSYVSFVAASAGAAVELRGSPAHRLRSKKGIGLEHEDGATTDENDGDDDRCSCRARKASGTNAEAPATAEAVATTESTAALENFMVPSFVCLFVCAVDRLPRREEMSSILRRRARRDEEK